LATEGRGISWRVEGDRVWYREVKMSKVYYMYTDEDSTMKNTKHCLRRMAGRKG
jgi:hypothetical protein